MVLPQIHSDPNILNSWRFTEATNYLIIHHSNFENHSIIPQSTQASTSSSSLHLYTTMAFLSATHFSLGLQQKHHENQKEIWGMPTPWVLPPAWCAGMGFSTLHTSLWCGKHQAKENNPHTHTHTHFLLLQIIMWRNTYQKNKEFQHPNFEAHCIQWITQHRRLKGTMMVWIPRCSHGGTHLHHTSLNVFG